MSQHDYIIDNQQAAVFRGDVNAALQALASNNAGPTEPLVKYAHMWWPDTAAGMLKQRDAVNTAWIVRGTLAKNVVLARSSDTALAPGDFGKAIVATGTFTQTFAAAATLGAGWWVDYRNDGTGTVTLDPATTEQIDGGATLALRPGETCKIVCDGTRLVTLGRNTSSAPPGLLHKTDPTTVAFTKTGADTLAIKAGTKVEVAGTTVTFAGATTITMPALTAGTDYAIYTCTDGSLRADSNASAPAGYTTANSRKIGGFHYGLVAAGTTVAGGSFNTAGSPVTGGMVWTQAAVDDIAGINKYSLWDLKFRPACADPRGMVLVNGRTWVDVYLCSTDTAANGTSKAGANIASGTVLPKLPVAFGGDGTLTYNALSWWVANELARANQKRLMLASEFYDAAFGVTENQSIDATTSTYPVTQRNPGYTSRYGIEQAAGVHYTWGQDSGGSGSAWVANGGRGQSVNNSVVRVLLGGARTRGSLSGSRCSNWNYVSSYSNWYIGLRAASDHLILA